MRPSETTMSVSKTSIPSPEATTRTTSVDRGMRPALFIYNPASGACRCSGDGRDREPLETDRGKLVAAAATPDGNGW